MKTPYELRLNDEPFLVIDKPSSRSEYLKEHPECDPSSIGLIALAGFRNNSYVDYIAIGRIDDVEEEATWIRVHEQYEFFDWMAGVVYRDPEREKQLKDMERNMGHFLLQFGFSPDYVLETEPSDYEMESYISHVVSKDEDEGGGLVIPDVD